MIASAVTLLPEPDSPTMPMRLTGRDVEVDAAHGLSRHDRDRRTRP